MKIIEREVNIRPKSIYYKDYLEQPDVIPVPQPELITVASRAGMIPGQYSEVLSLCDGKRTIGQIASLVGRGVRESIEILTTLANWKLIFLRTPENKYIINYFLDFPFFS